MADNYKSLDPGSYDGAGGAHNTPPKEPYPTPEKRMDYGSHVSECASKVNSMTARKPLPTAYQGGKREAEV